jgi:hypothetical protein
MLQCVGLEPFLHDIFVRRPCKDISIGTQPNLLNHAANPLPIFFISNAVSPKIIHTIAKAILVQLI